jgi:ABC-type Fe3+-hydroxamate transport system substrate-binding protein
MILDFIPQRIISLVPSQTELLFDLGLYEEVVGITKFCIHPKEICKQKTKIGGTKKFNFEKIDALKPDLIIGNKEENYKEGIEKLAEKYLVWISDIVTFEDAIEMINTIGILVNKEKESKNLIQRINLEFEKIKFITLKPPKVAYLIWNEPIMIAAKNTFIDAMLEKAGFQNAFPQLNRYPEISLQTLQNTDLDYIFLSSEPFPFKQKHLTFFQKNIPNAITQIVDGELFSWYGSRLLKSADYFLNLR